MTLRRFIARRGKPSVVFSDNAKTFLGTNNVLQSVDWEKIEEYGTTRRIRWRFNPPTAAWWGGWWERLIGMLKKILRKVLGRSRLSLEELTTLVCNCESLMNSRPLTYLSEDPQDLVPLSPAMFLLDPRDNDVAEIGVIEEQGFETRIRYRQKLRKILQKRFRSEYLGKLVNFGKSKDETRLLKVGQVVLIGQEDIRRTDWPLARVEELIPGNDGNVRLAVVRTAKGSMLRPLQRLYILEGVNSEDFKKEI
uniref:30S ribosomal protein S8 n=1 Tax=Lygus hesperus TaxID=30085 RepID=A0A0A9WXB7_LYGHE